MAQTGFTPILIYSSSTTTNAPAVGNLTNSTFGSELAINITDGKLFYKDNANAIQVIGWKTTPTTAGGTGLTSYTAGDLLYYATGTTLSKLAIGTAYQALQVNAGATAPSWQPSATSVLTTQGDLLYASAANTLARLAKNTTATRYLSNTGASNNPAWAQIDLSNGVTGSLPNANLANSSITINGTSVSLGGSIDVNNSGPAFLAYQNASISIATATYTVLPINTKTFDTATNFNTTTYRFTPNVAGYYQISAVANYFPAGGGNCFLSIFKNGSEYLRGPAYVDAGLFFGLSVNGIVSMNGSTDYLELRLFQSTGISQTYNPGAGLCYFGGSIIRKG